MKKHSSILFTLVLILSLLTVVLSASEVKAQTLYELQDSWIEVGLSITNSDERLAQTFTVIMEDHTVSQVSLRLERRDLPGPVTVSIRATDPVTGLPTGPDLTSTTVPEAELYSILPPRTPGWVTILLSPHPLTLGNTYAIVVKAPYATPSEYLVCRCSSSGTAWPFGTALYSDTSGINWHDQYCDLGFGVWGDRIITTPTATGTGDVGFASNQGTIEDLTPVDESTLPTTGKPDIEFPHGFFSFEITDVPVGGEVTVTLVLPEAVPVGTQYWKYHADSGWYRIMPIGDDDGDNTITFNLIDGVSGHDDDGESNGIIVDVGGVGIPPALDADFSGTPTSGPAPLTVAFTDLSTGEIDTWSWDFGDTGTSSAQHSSHTYYTPGDYTVSLTVSGPGGSDTETKVDYISVSESATEVWVDDDWEGLNPGDPADGHTFGYDAFADIQDGIDAVVGSTVHVADGTYNENVVVNKSDIIIRSDNGSSVTIVKSNTTDMHVFNITDQTNVTLQGFEIRDAYGMGIQDVAGIYMNNASHCNITDNNVVGNGHGICLEDAHHNHIERNMIVDNGVPPSGVHLNYGSNYNEIHENCFYNNAPQAYDDGTDNNWDGNYWSPSPGPGDYIIPGDAESEDTDPLDVCPLIEPPSPLNITKTDNVNGCVDPGDPITYTICYDNQPNPDAAVHNVVINDTLPAGVTFVSASDSGSYDTGTRNVSWDVGTVQAGAPETRVTLNVTVNTGTDGQTLENCATIKSDETEPAEACVDTQVCTAEPTPTPTPYPTPINHIPVPAVSPPGVALMIGLLVVAGSVMLRRRE